MKKLISTYKNESIISEEMAIVGWFGEQPNNNDYKIFIIEKNHTQPHFYLQYKNKRNKDYYLVTISIKDFEVMNFKRGIPHKLPKSTFELLINFLKYTKKNSFLIEKINNWDFLIILWDTAIEESPLTEVADLDKMKERGDFIYNKFSGV